MWQFKTVRRYVGNPPVTIAKGQQRGLLMFLCCQWQQADEQTFDWSVNRDAMTVIDHRRNARCVKLLVNCMYNISQLTLISHTIYTSFPTLPTAKKRGMSVLNCIVFSLVIKTIFFQSIKQWCHIEYSLPYWRVSHRRLTVLTTAKYVWGSK